MTLEKDPPQNPYLAEVVRMSGLDYAHQLSPQAWAELAKWLKVSSASIEHAKRIVTNWIAQNDGYPTPGILARFAGTVPADPALDHAELPPPCKDCAPYAGQWQMVRTSGGAEATDRCGCERGKRLAAMEAAKKGAKA